MARLAGFLLALMAGLALVSGPARADPSVFDDARLEVTPLLNGPAPYPRELVLLRIRGVYRPLINQSKLIQPELVDFAWSELGQDAVRVIEEDGYAKREFTRVIAVYPSRSGTLTIGPFVHRLKVVDGAERREIEVRSKPVELKVAAWSGPGGPDDPQGWWLPARSVTVRDAWSGDPDRVPRGETLTRTVTVTADGAPADMLPPTPKLLSPGVISFLGPTSRETRITPSGPVSQVTYSWEARPTTAYPATVQEIRIPWFDTTARKMREAVIPARRMAWAADGSGEPAPAKRAAAPMLAAAGALALSFAFGVALLLWRAGGAPRLLPEREPQALRALRRAARRSDAAGVRAAVSALSRHDPARARRWREDPEARAALSALDRRLFGPADEPAPDLNGLARAIGRAWRASRPDAAPPSGLPPLDGRSAKR
ncbi:hypothetical protein GCM10008171_12730 [Methylopila jiangsuensis]|uniref:Oxygen tolerance n=1 Tax=Methylopila jiangsuensis TaxID=586230 RepID=A0A9W6JHA0_9HYPH|nr:hypothetical protein [Methylopila jiangsuensis]MDR6286256.1 hypothetical protein [Methylopila jiangsuensis]GLK76019.1 hypothetical protein GCM10008171_12730 [Methylopila jiangsuensis]